jgi:hypothetical protein
MMRIPIIVLVAICLVTTCRVSVSDGDGPDP